MSNLKILDLGKQNYKEIWDLQKELHAKRIAEEIPDTLIFVEHNPVVTLGKSGKNENIKVPIEFLKRHGIELYHIERGGDVTIHTPGQLVGYPIFNIKKGLVGIKLFIEKIEATIINVLGNFGIFAKKREKMIGIWVGEKKICSIGIAVKSGVSFHGFAININNDLKYFDLINPCGFKEIKMTSMQEILQYTTEMDDVKKAIIKNFVEIFGFNTTL